MIQVVGIYENGFIRLLSPIPRNKAKVVVTVIEEPDQKDVVSSLPSSRSNRVPGLHKGVYFMADDFDAPLPDSFWLGEA